MDTATTTATATATATSDTDAGTADRPLGLGGSSKYRKDFDRIDKDKSGYIDEADLKSLLKTFKLDAFVTDEKLDKIISSVDKNRDGRISFDEYMKVAKKVEMAMTMAKKFGGGKKD